jgi:hypothetical protein
MKIAQPYCDWITLPFKDKRRGSLWHCRECGASGGGRKVPKCPCREIELSDDR